MEIQKEHINTLCTTLVIIYMRYESAHKRQAVQGGAACSYVDMTVVNGYREWSLSWKRRGRRR